MFEPMEEEPRGFTGRPFAATVFAVALGSVGAEVGSRLQLTDATVYAILIVLLIVVGYIWERLETSRSE
ncbi:MAG: hypothetical protein WAK48_10540 [Candidatus Acidiferrum sp.]|jgi:hypothetical protein